MCNNDDDDDDGNVVDDCEDDGRGDDEDEDVFCQISTRCPLYIWWLFFVNGVHIILVSGYGQTYRPDREFKSTEWDLKRLKETFAHICQLFKEKKKQKKWIQCQTFRFCIPTNHISLFISVMIISCHMTVLFFSGHFFFFFLNPVGLFVHRCLYLKTMKSRVIN